MVRQQQPGGAEGKAKLRQPLVLARRLDRRQRRGRNCTTRRALAAPRGSRRGGGPALEDGGYCTVVFGRRRRRRRSTSQPASHRDSSQPIGRHSHQACNQPQKTRLTDAAEAQGAPCAPRRPQDHAMARQHRPTAMRRRRLHSDPRATDEHGGRQRQAQPGPGPRGVGALPS